MTINLTIFNKINVVDSCSVWNILSCNMFYSRALEDKCEFSITKYVEYECLIKPRSEESLKDLEIKKKLTKEMEKGMFKSCNLSIEDLQESEIISSRKRLGMGELSSIAFAKKINQSFLTDDQSARKFANSILGTNKVQTTPHLLGFLIYKGIIFDGELTQIIADHNSFGRPLETYFQQVCNEALRIRLIGNPKSSS